MNSDDPDRLCSVCGEPFRVHEIANTDESVNGFLPEEVKARLRQTESDPFTETDWGKR